MKPSEINEWHAFIVGLQVMALVTAFFINLLGSAVGADYYIESVPFFGVAGFAPLFGRLFLKDPSDKPI